MKKITNERYKESYIEETLDNGLHVVLWEKPDYEKSLFMMAAPLGALDLHQKDEGGTLYEFPAGIAHFLEHKMFETENGDIMEEFSQAGANVNAFTSYTETAYYFSTSGEIEAPLNLLLDFVQELCISEASVEKEKGIILQELNMYRQMSDSRLLMETYASLFHEHPLRFDIGGDKDSVSATTKEQLYDCYRLNYHPTRTMLVGVCGKDSEHVLQIIKKNQQAKHFENVRRVQRKSFHEPAEVKRKQYSFSMDISVPKLSVAYKLEGIRDIKERIRREWCVRIMLDVCFSSLNPKFQEWIDAGIINDFVGCDIDYGEDYGVLMFYGETEKREAFLQIVNDSLQQLQKGDIKEEELNRLKKRYFGQTIRGLNSFDDIAITAIRNYFDGCDFFASLDILSALTLSDVRDACRQISGGHVAVVEITPEKSQ